MDNIQSKAGSEGVAVTTLRLPVKLRDDLKASAHAEGRSLNTHMVMALRQFEGAGQAAPATREKADEVA